jgi:leucyl aminopeptidase (aminopeptidase T)
VLLEEVIRDSTIILSMTEYSSSAPLRAFATKYKYLRIAAMPQISRSMEETGLSADPQQIAAACDRVARLFAGSDGIEVTFSTGHQCYFDISDHNTAFQDNGLLHPGTWQGVPCFSNLPAGEVYACPNEAEDSQTCGEIPALFDGETIVFVIRNNRIVDIQGQGPVAEAKGLQFHNEPALCNVAEVAIGCNARAVARGDGLNILEDLKAGFTWAYGRSDFIGGRVGAEDFSADKVWHQDLVYARGNPIHCTRMDFVLADGTRKTAILDGVRCGWMLEPSLRSPLTD